MQVHCSVFPLSVGMLLFLSVGISPLCYMQSNSVTTELYFLILKLFFIILRQMYFVK